MTPYDTTRRTVVKTTGAAIATALIAGCLGGDDDGDDGNGDGNGSGNGNDEFAIDSGTDVVLDGYASHWEGVEPSAIDGVENPTLVLEEGGEYTFEWINADGMAHDLQLQDDGGDALESTDEIDAEGEGATLEFTADADMVTYICTLHPNNQVGDLVVE